MGNSTSTTMLECKREDKEKKGKKERGQLEVATIPKRGKRGGKKERKRSWRSIDITRKPKIQDLDSESECGLGVGIGWGHTSSEGGGSGDSTVSNWD